jgi:hypothetical protein
VIVGNAQAWADRFVSLDDRFLERIVTHWPASLGGLGPDPLEDEITINLVHLLSIDPVVRRLCHFVAYQHEPFGIAPSGARFSKGRIDMAVLFDWERERYMAYECKRLCARTGTGRASLATTYVVDGMMRFITEQYAQDLPVGGMLGYVIDGDTDFAERQVHLAIGAHAPLALSAGPTSRTPIGEHRRFETEHGRIGTGIRLRHALLAYPGLGA